MPKIVSEDVGFALAARERGYRGKYVEKPFCHEALPETYSAFIRQQAKYTRGACEVLSRYWRTLVYSRKLRWFEKLDCTLMVASNICPGLFCAFLVLIAVVVPALFYEPRFLHLDAGNQARAIWLVLTPGAMFRRILTWDFYTIYLLSVLAPLFAALTVDRQRIAERVRFLVWATLLCYSVIPQALFESAAYALTQRAAFTATGDRTLRQRSGVAQGIVWWCNLTVGVVFCVSAAVTFNLFLAAIGFAVLVGIFGADRLQDPARSGLNTAGSLPTTVAAIPIVLTVLAVLFFGSGLIAGQAGSLMVAPFHF